jgi:hypothetical protein
VTVQNTTVSPIFREVHIIAENLASESNVFGMINRLGGQVVCYDLQMTATCGVGVTNASCVGFLQSETSTLDLKRVTLDSIAGNNSQAYAIKLQDTTRLTSESCDLTAVCGDNGGWGIAYGVYLSNSALATVRQTRITIEGGTDAGNYGIAAFNSSSLTLNDCDISAIDVDAPFATGLDYQSSNTTMTAINTIIRGTSRAVRQTTGEVRLATCLLQGSLNGTFIERVRCFDQHFDPILDVDLD